MIHDRCSYARQDTSKKKYCPSPKDLINIYSAEDRISKHPFITALSSEPIHTLRDLRASSESHKRLIKIIRVIYESLQ